MLFSFDVNRHQILTVENSSIDNFVFSYSGISVKYKSIKWQQYKKNN